MRDQVKKLLMAIKGRLQFPCAINFSAVRRGQNYFDFSGKILVFAPNASTIAPCGGFL